MGKLWPPTCDDFSARFWAAVASVVVNGAAGLLVYGHAVTEPFFFLFFAPGLYAFMLVTHQDLEGARFSWLGFIAGGAANFAFYYLVAWLLIRSFRHATNWWPERRA